MRALVLALLSPHPHTTVLPNFLTHIRIRTAERVLNLSELLAALAAGTLQETFCVGTAAVLISAARMRWQCQRSGAIAEWIFGGARRVRGVGRSEPLMRD